MIEKRKTKVNEEPIKFIVVRHPITVEAAPQLQAEAPSWPLGWESVPQLRAEAPPWPLGWPSRSEECLPGYLGDVGYHTEDLEDANEMTDDEYEDEGGDDPDSCDASLPEEADALYTKSDLENDSDDHGSTERRSAD